MFGNQEHSPTFTGRVVCATSNKVPFLSGADGREARALAFSNV
jgi:hypothetical protein